MTPKVFISIYLDTRRAKEGGLYPVRLRVFTSAPRKQKFYSTKYEYSVSDFKKITESKNLRSSFREDQIHLSALVTHANKVADSIVPFSFEQFEKKLYMKQGDSIGMDHLFSEAIQRFEKGGQVSTASTYNLSRKSIQAFLKAEKRQSYDSLNLLDITAEWLQDYERYMTIKMNKSLTTVSMYVRALKALYNKAIDEKEIDSGHYPFGKRKYQVPATRNIKKALSFNQLSALFHVQPDSKEQQKARDFWFFSYSCNGMNVKDIALLKFEDIKGEKLEFIRAKTRITSKGNQKAISVHLTGFSQGIIKKYGNQDKTPGNRVFNILELGMTPVQEQARIKAFTRFINQHIKKLADLHNDRLTEAHKKQKADPPGDADLIPNEISTYWARHSFATVAIRKGAAMELIQESLGHRDLSTTQNYFAGFDKDTKAELAESLMNFNQDKK